MLFFIFQINFCKPTIFLSIYLLVNEQFYSTKAYKLSFLIHFAKGFIRNLIFAEKNYEI